MYPRKGGLKRVHAGALRVALRPAFRVALRAAQRSLAHRPCAGGCLKSIEFSADRRPQVLRYADTQQGAHRCEASPVSSTTKDQPMNKDQVKGAVKDAAGKVQEQTGKLMGSTGQQLKGLNKQAEGKAQKAVGDVKEVVKDIAHK